MRAKKSDWAFGVMDPKTRRLATHPRRDTEYRVYALHLQHRICQATDLSEYCVKFVTRFEQSLLGNAKPDSRPHPKVCATVVRMDRINLTLSERPMGRRKPSNRPIAVATLGPGLGVMKACETPPAITLGSPIPQTVVSRKVPVVPSSLIRRARLHSIAASTNC